MVIRQLKQSDWQQLKSIRLESLKNASYAFGSRYENEEKLSGGQWQSLLTAENRYYFGCLDSENEVMAMAGIKLQNQQWLIFGVYLKPQYRGQVIMPELLKYIINNTRDLLANSGLPLGLTVVTSNISAVKIYQQLGFTITKELEPREMGDGSLSAEYLMELI